jgi:hypothetical protein
MSRPRNGIYIIQNLTPRYAVWVMYHGRVIDGRPCHSYDAAHEEARRLQAQLAALPILDQAHPEEEEEERAA